MWRQILPDSGVINASSLSLRYGEAGERGYLDPPCVQILGFPCGGSPDCVSVLVPTGGFSPAVTKKFARLVFSYKQGFAPFYYEHPYLNWEEK